MELESGRFHHERVAQARAQVERHLVRSAGAGRYGYATPSRVDRSVQMPAGDLHDLRMAGNDAAQRLGIREAAFVHALDSGPEWRVMHEDERRSIGCLVEPRFEPREPLRAERATAFAGHHRVERDQSQRVAVDHVLHEFAIRKPVAVGERLPERAALIVIAGNAVNRHRERSEQVAQVTVFARVAEVGEVAGDEHDVGSGIEAVHPIDAAFEQGAGVDDAVRQRASQLEVEIADLGDENWRLLRSRRRIGTRVDCFAGAVLLKSGAGMQFRRFAVSRIRGFVEGKGMRSAAIVLRGWSVACAIVLGLAAVSSNAAAADYPSKPITLIVPFTAGGGTDQVARAFAEALKKELGQPVVVQNLPGAGSAIGTTRLHESAADGYTLGMTGGFLISTAIRGQFKPSPMDFTHLARLSQETFVLATQAGAPYAKLSDYLTASRAKPGTISIATAGAGALTDLAAEALNQETKASLNVVNFPGGARELTAVLGGHASAGVFSQVEVLPQVGPADGLRVLAVFGETRSEKMPDVPTLKELGITGVPAGPWQGIAAPKGIPAPVKAKLIEAIAKATHDPGWLAFLAKSGLASSYLTGAPFETFLNGEVSQLGRLMKSIGLVK